MNKIFEKPVKQTGLLLADAKKAKAIGDPIRAAILQILSKREGSIADIKAKLEEKGIGIAPTTVRHHVDVLKKAGLIELTGLVNSKGGMLKYYASNVRLIEHSAPENFEEVLEDAVKEAAGEVLRLFEEIFKKHKTEIEETAESLKPCPYCSEEHFIEYVLLEVLNRAAAEATQRKEFKALLKE
jgi:DNA-binding transcriptional ArsR family regulator